MNSFEIITKLQFKAKNHLSNGGCEDLIDEWFILPTDSETKVPVIESSRRLLSNIIPIDTDVFVLGLFQDKPVGKVDKLSNKEEWIKAKCNLNVYQVSTTYKKYIIINLSTRPKKKLLIKKVPAIWPPEWIQDHHQYENASLVTVLIKTPLKRIYNCLYATIQQSALYHQPATTNIASTTSTPIMLANNLCSSPEKTVTTPNTMDLTFLSPTTTNSSSSRSSHKTKSPLSSFIIQSPAVNKTPLQRIRQTASNLFSSISIFTGKGEEEKEESIFMVEEKDEVDTAPKILFMSDNKNHDKLSPEVGIQTIVVDSSTNQASHHHSHDKKLLGTMTMLPTDLISPDNLKFYEQLLFEIDNLYKSEGKEMMIPTFNNIKKPRHIQKIPQFKSYQSFLKNSQQKDSWMINLLNKIGGNNPEESALWMTRFFASRFKDVFLLVANEIGVIIRWARMSAKEAIAMVIDAGVNMNMAIIMFRHLRYIYGLKMNLPLTEMYSLGNQCPKMKYGLLEILNDDDDDTNEGEQGDNHDDDEDHDAAPHRLRRQRRRGRRKKKTKIEYWTVDGGEAISIEVDKALASKVETNPHFALHPERALTFGYKTSIESCCCEISIGSDHGQGADRCAARMQTVCPSKRKMANDPNLDAIHIEPFHVKCKSDTAEVTEVTSHSINKFIDTIENYKLVGVMDLNNTIRTVMIPKKARDYYVESSRNRHNSPCLNLCWAQDDEAGNDDETTRKVELRSDLNFHESCDYRIWVVIPKFVYWVVGKLLLHTQTIISIISYQI